MTAQPVTRTAATTHRSQPHRPARRDPASVPAVRPARRAGVAAWAAAVLLVLLVAANLLGVVMFGLVWADDPVGPGLVFLVMVVATGLTALAAVPGLLRGARTAWAVVTTWAVAYEYWTVYKVFGELEWISLPHLAVGAALLGLLALPAVRPARVVLGDR